MYMNIQLVLSLYYSFHGQLLNLFQNSIVYE